jgi:phosphogluconate dehydratase
MESVVHPVVAQVTARVRTRSAVTRSVYLQRMAAARSAGSVRGKTGCTNLAHAFAASDADDKAQLRAARWPNIGIVSAYNDMLSAHQPFERRCPVRRRRARDVRWRDPGRDRYGAESVLA